MCCDGSASQTGELKTFPCATLSSIQYFGVLDSCLDKTTMMSPWPLEIFFTGIRRNFSVFPYVL